MDQSPPQTKKATLRIGARERVRLQAALVVIICIMLWVVVFRPWIQGLVGNREFQNCQTNAHKIARALTMYQGDWDDAYPPGPSWMTAILGNMAATSGTGFDLQKYLKCPVDRSSGASSYFYNDVLAGINPALSYRGRDPEKETRRLRVRSPQHLPLIIEKHGVALNAYRTLAGWDDVIREMSFPHHLPEPTGILINGAGNPTRRTKQQVSQQAGKRF